LKHRKGVRQRFRSEEGREKKGKKKRKIHFPNAKVSRNMREREVGRKTIKNAYLVWGGGKKKKGRVSDRTLLNSNCLRG